MAFHGESNVVQFGGSVTKSRPEDRGHFLMYVLLCSLMMYVRTSGNRTSVYEVVPGILERGVSV